MYTEQNKISNISRGRILAAEIVYQISEHKAYTNIALEKYLRNSELPQVDKNLVTEIVNGTIRMIKHLDWVLNLFLKSDIKGANPWIKVILRMGLYQILFMDKTPNYAVVNDAVELARKKTNHNLSKLTNGVLRNIIRNIDSIEYPKGATNDYLATYYSHPKWLVEKLLDIYSYSDLEEILLYNNQRPGLHIRVNTLKAGRDELIEMLGTEDIVCEPSRLLPNAININKLNSSLLDSAAYNKGYFYIQNTASMLAALILDPQPHDFVYDLCSGLGGKATHLAELMGDQGKIHCYDIYDQKLKILNTNAKRLGINIITTNLNDVLTIETQELANAVLLDAPCSGLGVLNRRSDLRWNIGQGTLLELRKLQSDLLTKASQLVRAGGYLLYATCTINPRENEGIVNEFLDKNEDFGLTGFEDRICDFPLVETDRAAARYGMLTITPGKYQTDGMFYALLKRKDAG